MLKKKIIFVWGKVVRFYILTNLQYILTANVLDILSKLPPKLKMAATNYLGTWTKACLEYIHRRFGPKSHIFYSLLFSTDFIAISFSWQVQLPTTVTAVVYLDLDGISFNTTKQNSGYSWVRIHVPFSRTFCVFFSEICKLECNTTSDWLNRMV